MRINTENSDHRQRYTDFNQLLGINRRKEVKKKKREIFIDIIWAIVFIIVFLKETVTFGSLSVWISILIMIMDVITFILCVKVITLNISFVNLLKSITYQIETIELPVYIRFWAKEEIDSLTTYTYILEINPNEINITPKNHFLMNDDQVVSYKTNRRLEVGEQAKYLANVILPVCYEGTEDHYEVFYINHVIAVGIPEIDLVVDYSSQSN